MKSCSCKKISSSGYPCWHLIAVFNNKKAAIIDELLNLVNNRWKYTENYSNHLLNYDLENESYKTGSVSKSKFRRQTVGSKSPFKGTSLKKAKTTPKNSASSTTTVRDVIDVRTFKDSTQVRQNSIKFLKNNNNSCRFDAFLAESMFFENETDYLQQYLSRVSVEKFQVLYDSIVNINNGQLETTQKLFIDYCIKAKLTSHNENEMGSILGLYEQFYNEMNVEHFSIKTQVSYTCRSKFDCPNKNLYIRDQIISPILKIEIDKDHKSIQDSLSDWPQEEKQTLCEYCYEEDFNPIPSSMTTKLIDVPLYLKISLESIFSVKNRVKKGFSVYQINQKLKLSDHNYDLKSIIYFVNQIHYIIEVCDIEVFVKKNKKVLKGWFCYDDLNGDIIKIDAPRVLKQDFKISNRNFPLLVTYKRI